MENANEFIREHGKTLRMALRNSKLSTDKLQRRISLMRKSLQNNEDKVRLDEFERKMKAIIDITGKDQFSEEDIDIILRQSLGLEIREYDKSHLVNLDHDEIKSVQPKKEPVDKKTNELKSYTYGDTTITKIGALSYTDWQGNENLAGLPYYKIEIKNKAGKSTTYKAFTHINIGMMDSDADYREAVLYTLLDEKNITKTNCGGYIGSIGTVEEGKNLEDTVKANSKYSLIFDSTDATAVVKFRTEVKKQLEEDHRLKLDDERE